MEPDAVLNAANALHSLGYFTSRDLQDSVNSEMFDEHPGDSLGERSEAVQSVSISGTAHNLLGIRSSLSLMNFMRVNFAGVYIPSGTCCG